MIFGRTPPNSLHTCSSSTQQHYDLSTSKKRFRDSLDKQSRENQFKRLRMLSNLQMIPYLKVKYQQFAQTVEMTENPYNLLLTVFSIIEQFSWRQFLPHLQLLIKKLTNMFQSSKGQFLYELAQVKISNEYSPFAKFQQKIEKMLYLSDKVFQEHLLIFLHCLIAYDPVYKIMDQESLSPHLLHKHPYQRNVREEVLWVMTIMSVNQTAISKILKIYQTSQSKSSILLPILTILSNYIAQAPSSMIEQLLTQEIFQKIICDSITSGQYPIQRQASLLCNNIVFKNENCQHFLLSQNNVISILLTLENEESIAFQKFIEQKRNLMQSIQNFYPLP